MGSFDCFMTVADGANNNSSITAFWGLICFCTINLLFLDVCFKVTLSAAFAVYSVYRRLFQNPPNYDC